jgi:hypothetical protein
MEMDLRKREGITGTPVELGNGEEWIIPTVPLTDEGVELAKLMDAVDEAAKDTEHIANSVEAMKGMVEALLGINYNITQKQIADANLVNLENYNDLLGAAMGLSKKNVDTTPESSGGLEETSEQTE